MERDGCGKKVGGSRRWENIGVRDERESRERGSVLVMFGDGGLR